MKTLRNYFLIFFFILNAIFVAKVQAATEDTDTAISLELLNLQDPAIQQDEIVGNPLANEQVLKEYCAAGGGQMVNQLTCPASKKVRKEPFCIVKNEQQQKLFFNGCTGTNGKWGTMFFSACVLHDFCYHSEPGFSGQNKKDCDKQFLSNLRKICESNTSKTCRSMALSFYQAVKLGGSSWECSKNNFSHPKSFEDLPWHMASTSLLKRDSKVVLKNSKPNNVLSSDKKQLSRPVKQEAASSESLKK